MKKVHSVQCAVYSQGFLLAWFFLFTVHCSLFTPAVFAEPLLIDDFDAGSANKLGGTSNTYVMEPSKSLALRVKENPHNGVGALMIKYDKKGVGGPQNSGGWCGYYTLLRTGTRFLDATPYQSLTFWVRGQMGEENFVVGLADRHWDEVGDSVKSEPIGQYLPERKLTSQWQKATIPLSTFFVDLKQLASIAVCFEGSIFPGGTGKGTVYIDDLMLE